MQQAEIYLQGDLDSERIYLNLQGTFLRYSTNYHEKAPAIAHTVISYVASRITEFAGELSPETLNLATSLIDQANLLKATAASRS